MIKKAFLSLFNNNARMTPSNPAYDVGQMIGVSGRRYHIKAVKKYTTLADGVLTDHYLTQDGSECLLRTYDDGRSYLLQPYDDFEESQEFISMIIPPNDYCEIICSGSCEEFRRVNHVIMHKAENQEDAFIYCDYDRIGQDSAVIHRMYVQFRDGRVNIWKGDMLNATDVKQVLDA